MSENKIPEQAAAQELRSQCRDAGRGFHGPQMLANATIFSRSYCYFKISGYVYPIGGHARLRVRTKSKGT